MDGNRRAFQLERRPIITAAVLIGVGASIALAGVSIATRSAVSQGLQWFNTMDPPVGDVAKVKWRQLQAAGTAGADAWKKSFTPAGMSS